MEYHTLNKQTISINQDKAWKQKAFAKINSKKRRKKASNKQTTLDKAANNIK